jgi:hypothetical protein
MNIKIDDNILEVVNRIMNKIKDKNISTSNLSIEAIIKIAIEDGLKSFEDNIDKINNK